MKKYCNDNKNKIRCASLDFVENKCYCLAYKKNLNWYKATKLIVACDECQKKNKNEKEKA